MTKRICFAIFAVWIVAVAAAQGSEEPSILNCRALKPVEDPDVIVQAGRIICVAKKKGAVSIPIGQVTEIAYDFTSVSNAKRVSEDPMDYFSSEEGILGLATVVIGPLIAKGINTRLRPHHFVFVKWNSGREDATAVFRVQERAVGSFLERVSQLTGKEYRDRFLDAGELPAGALCYAPTTATLQANITREYLRCVDASGRIVNVHRANIRRVAYDVVSLSDRSGFEQYLARDDSEALGWPLRFAAEHVPHERQHYAFVYWLVDGRSRVAVYRLDEELRPRFLSRLKDVGLDWEDGVAAREKLQAEVERVPKSGKAQVYVDRQIHVGAYTIGPGHFEFVILESETGLDHLLIQDLSAISSCRRLVVPAHLIATNDRWSQGDLVYEDAEATVPEVLEIRFPMRKIRPIA